MPPAIFLGLSELTPISLVLKIHFFEFVFCNFIPLLIAIESPKAAVFSPFANKIILNAKYSFKKTGKIL
ncbi:MAG: hypothetical protein EA409_07310 [Saprospirales bacterium]|nr:MAG: hypothetical protein EA409_07310 [Saprospirales bacterium]